MIELTNELGSIEIANEVFTTLAGAAATNCFGVKGMAMRSYSDGIVHLLKREAMGKGVLVIHDPDGSISIELHIIVELGVNLSAVTKSIINEVRYKVEGATGITVKSVDIYIDSMILD